MLRLAGLATRSFSNVLLALLLLGAAACTSDRTMQPLTEANITAGGGNLISADGRAVLRFPAGAVSEPTKITIRRVSRDEELLHEDVYGDATYEFGPDGQQFAEPVMLEISGATGENMALAQIFSNRIEIVGDSTYDPVAKVVSGHIEHFSSYGIVAVHPSCAGRMCGDSCTLCDPADPSCVELPIPRACDRHGWCAVAIAPLGCFPDGGVSVPDSGVRYDSGIPSHGDGGSPLDIGPRPDSGPDGGIFVPDAGMIPGDGGMVPDAGIPDAMVPPGDGGGMATVIAEIEPNNSLATAQSTTLGQGRVTMAASLAPSGDEDWYSFEVPFGVVANVWAITHTDVNNTAVCTSADTVLTLFDSTGAILAMNDDGNGLCSEILTALGQGVYYLRVVHFDSMSVIPSYYLTLAVHWRTGGDGGTFPGDGGVFPGDGGGTPGDGGGTPGDGGIRPDVGPRDGGFFPSDGSTGPGDGGGGTPGDGGIFVPDAGLFDGSTSPDAMTPPDGGGSTGPDAGFGGAWMESEPNHPIGNANAIPVASPGTTTIGGAISPAGDQDFFVFTAGGGGAAVNIHAVTHSDPTNPNICAGGTDTVLALLDSAGNMLAENDDNGTMCSEIDVTVPGGTYYLKVRHFAPGGTIGAYYLTVDIF